MNILSAKYYQVPFVSAKQRVYAEPNMSNNGAEEVTWAFIVREQKKAPSVHVPSTPEGTADWHCRAATISSVGVRCYNILSFGVGKLWLAAAEVLPDSDKDMKTDTEVGTRELGYLCLSICNICLSTVTKLQAVCLSAGSLAQNFRSHLTFFIWFF